MDKNKWLDEWQTKQDYINGYYSITQYEKYMLCNYLISLIEFIEIDRKFKDFYYKLDNVFNIHKKEFTKFFNKPIITHENEYKFKQNLKKVLIQKSKNFKNNNSKLANKILLVSKLYGLSKIEHEILQYYILQSTVPYINDIISLITGSFNVFVLLGTSILGLKLWVVNQIRRRMIKKGIFIKQGFNDNIVSLNMKILEIFENSEIKTQTQIKNILLGKNQKSELNWKDFDHLDKERDITLNILTSAIENNTKGINILLYGTVGTGKTQFAKVIANKAKIDMYAVSAEFMDKEASRKDRLSDFASKQTVLSQVEKSCILFDEAEDVMNRGFNDFGSASKAYLNNLI